MTINNSGLFLAGAHKKARTPRIANEGIWNKIRGKKAISRSRIQALDLISEGEIEGLVSGTFYYSGQTGDYGYISGRFEPFEPFTSVPGDPTSEVTVETNDEVRWLRSVYWNDIPLVDNSEQLNFPFIDVAFVRGTADGVQSTSDDSFSRQITRQATVTRNIGERLRGPNLNYQSVGKGVAKPVETFEDLYDPDNPTSPEHKRALVNAKRYRVINKNVTSIEVNIRVSSLQYRELTDPKKLGDARDSTIKYFINVSPIFRHNSQVPEASRATYIREVHRTVNGRVTKGFIDNTRINLPNMSSRDDFLAWEITIVRKTFDALDSRHENSCTVDSITEIYQDSYAYPHSAIVSSKFSAESFANVPNRSFDVRLMKIKVPSNYNPILRNYGQISGGARYYGDGGLKPNGTFSASSPYPFVYSFPFKRLDSDNSVSQGTQISAGDNPWDATQAPNFTDYYSSPGETVKNIGGLSEKELGDPTVNGTTDIWDGSFKSEKQWSDNPAWVFYDLVTNRRYGLGDYINEEDVDKWTLYKVAQYCDELVPDGEGGLEPRFSANVLINKRDEAFDVVNDVTSIFRAIAYYGQGSIFVSQDIAKEPVYIFNNSNVVEGNFNYSSSNRKARHNVFIVRYLDRNNFYLPAVEYVKDVESIKKYGEREAEVTAFGATSKSQAIRWGKWSLLSENLQTETVSFSAGIEASYLKPGDVIRIQDSNRSDYKFGGRVSGMKVDTIEQVNSVDTAKGAVITLDRYINFEGLKDDEGHDEGVVVLSVLAPRYFYEPINTDITSSEYLDEIRPKQFLEYNIYTGDSFTSDSDFDTDVHGYVSKQIGASGEYVNGLTEIILTGSVYDTNRIKVDDYQFEFNSSNFTTTPFSFTFHDYFNTSPKEHLYSVLGIKETDFGKYDILGLEYASGKYNQIEEEFSLAEFSSQYSDADPEPPVLNVSMSDEDGDNIIKYELKVNQLYQDGRYLDNPEHNTINLNLYIIQERIDTDTSPSNTDANAFHKEEFRPADPSANSAFNGDTVIVDILTVDGVNNKIEGTIDAGRAPGQYSFAGFSMNWKGVFSQMQTASITAEKGDGQGEISDILVYGLDLNETEGTKSNFAAGYGNNTNIVSYDGLVGEIEWFYASVTEKSFEDEYGYLTTSSDFQGVNQTRIPLESSEELITLVTFRAVATSFTDISDPSESALYIGTPSNLIYNFNVPWNDPSDPDYARSFKDYEFLTKRVAGAYASEYLIPTFSVYEGEIGLTQSIVQLNFAKLESWKDLQGNQKNFLYEFGPPREYDVVVEVINKLTKDPENQRIPSSASTDGLGNYVVQDFIPDDANDPGTTGVNLGFDRLTIVNKRPVHFYLMNRNNSVSKNSYSIASYDSSADNYLTTDLNSTDVYVTYNNKIYVLIQNYSGTKNPATADGLNYWLEINSICFVNVAKRGSKIELTPIWAIEISVNPADGQLGINKFEVSNFSHDLFEELRNEGSSGLNARFSRWKSYNKANSNNVGYTVQDVFSRAFIYNTLSQRTPTEVYKHVTRQAQGGRVISTENRVPYYRTYTQIYTEDETLDDLSDAEIARKTTTYELDAELRDNDNFMSIATFDSFDYAFQNREYDAKALVYSNVIQIQ